ncbi:hypothetical protein [Muricoccus radiodurans]|uniref:hypothetical protein n=1 Tax=Muricoccus radiodurans TaxID=2231721 RepID=UPI003CEBFC9C
MRELYLTRLAAFEAKSLEGIFELLVLPFHLLRWLILLLTDPLGFLIVGGLVVGLIVAFFFRQSSDPQD